MEDTGAVNGVTVHEFLVLLRFCIAFIIKDGTRRKRQREWFYRVIPGMCAGCRV